MAKVSVIIPAFNSASYISETIDSVLSQTYKDYEIIVVDDGSTDNTKNVLSKYVGRIKIFFQTNQGPSAARNFGIDQSSGQYIAFLDSDDAWLPSKLEKQVEELENHPELAFVCSGSYVMDGSSKIIDLWKRGKKDRETFEYLYEIDFVLILTVLLRRIAFYDVGRFDERLWSSQDYDLWLRLAKKYNFKYIDIPLAKYRIHKNNFSKNLDIKLSDRLIILNKQEVTRGYSFLKKLIRTSKAYYDIANEYLLVNNFFKAGFCYLQSVLIFPPIGYYYWPKEVENFKFSLPYRILKVYLLIMSCLFKAAIKRCKAL